MKSTEALILTHIIEDNISFVKTDIIYIDDNYNLQTPLAKVYLEYKKERFFENEGDEGIR